MALEDTVLPVFRCPPLLTFGEDDDIVAVLVCSLHLPMAGDAGERELDDVEEVAGCFLGLLSISNPLFADVLLTLLLSVAPFLCFSSFDTAPCRGLV